MNERDSIEKKLTKSFFKVASITAAVAILSLVALIIVSNRYSYALKNYGFAQGDIGKAMFEFADSRSSLRAAIGYDNVDAIATVVQQHNENKILFEEYFAIVENTIVSEDGRRTYDEISSELDAYWALARRSWISARRQTGNSARRHRTSHSVILLLPITVYTANWNLS